MSRNPNAKVMTKSRKTLDADKDRKNATAHRNSPLSIQCHTEELNDSHRGALPLRQLTADIERCLL
jgi:hypothetical protein